MNKTLLAILTAILPALFSAPASAQEVAWKLHSTFAENRAETQAAMQWASQVNARTAGKLKVTVYPGGTLGVSDTDMFRVLPNGNIIQATVLSPVYVTRDAPELAYSLPNESLDNHKDILKLKDTLNDIYNRSYKKRGIRSLGLIMSPSQSIYVYCKSPFQGLKDMKTRKTRVWGKPLSDALGALGVATSIIPQGELYVALQTGVVDCATYIADAANTISLQEVAPYYARLSPYASILQLIVSEKAWERLPADVQNILQEEAKKVEAVYIEKFVDGGPERAEAAKYNAAGGKYAGEFPAEDQKAYSAAARKVWLEQIKGFSGDAKDSAAQILSVLSK